MEKEELIEFAEEVGNVMGALEHFEEILETMEDRFLSQSRKLTPSEKHIVRAIRSFISNKDQCTELLDAVEERIDEVENESSSVKASSTAPQHEQNGRTQLEATTNGDEEGGR